MSQLELRLRLSLIRGELAKLADGLDPRTAKVVRYAVRILGMA